MGALMLAQVLRVHELWHSPQARSAVGALMCAQVTAPTERLVAPATHKRPCPLWVCSCVRNVLLRPNTLSHSPHMNGFAPLWVRSCLRNALPSLNAFSHSPQTNGLAPLWVRSCVRKVLLRRNVF
jgi:hypothetical protein